MSVRSLSRLFFGIAILSALIVSTGVANGCTTSSNTVSCIGSSNGTSVFASNGGQESGPEPTVLSAAATISVTGGSGTVSGVTVTLVGYNDNVNGANDGSGDMGLVLQSPSGRKFEIMRSVGEAGGDPSTITFTIADGGTPFPNANTTGTLVPLAGGTTYSPSAYNDSGIALEKDPNYSSAGLSGTILDAAPNGSSTFASVFTGDTVNGTWTLYLAADPNGFIADITFSSWNISVTFTAASTPSTTTLSPSSPVTGFPNFAFTSGSESSITLTATVTGSGATGTVTFKDGGSNITCSGGDQTVSGGQATCVTTFSTEGLHSLSANYSGDGTFEASSGTAGVFAMNHSPNGTGASATKYCNSGTITGTGESQSTETSPYPSAIFIGDGVNTDITSSVNTVSVILNNFQGVNSTDLHMLLVAPDGTHSLDFWSNAGSNLTTGTYTLIDGSTQLPATGSFSPGSYSPTTYGSGFTPNTDLFTPAPPAPAPQIPSTYSTAPPVGTNSFTSSFAGANAHGPWALFLYNGSGTGDTTTLSGGWCLDVSPGTGKSTSTSVTPSAQFNTKGTLVTFTATITSSQTVNEGTVAFTENGSPLVGAPNSGVASVSGGVATISTTALPEGDHTITATYQDSTDTFNESFSTASVRVDAATATPTLTSNTWSYCNNSGITIPAGTVSANDFGPAAPNPSNIFVTNLYGTISSVSLTLNSLKTTDGGNDLESLLVGPNGSSLPTSAQTLDFFSLVGNENAFGPETITFADSFSALGCSLTSSAPPAQDAPTSCGATSYTASLFYTLPSSIHHATTSGGFTFNTGTLTGTGGGVYANTNPNGAWSLYFDQTLKSTGDGVTGWCMNFTENPVTVSVTESHLGSSPSNQFTQGQQGAQLTTVITNDGPGSTGDPSQGTHPLTVTDTLNPAFTYQSFSGSGWSCNTSALPTVTCSNDSAIAQGSSYPKLTLNVNVSNSATSPISNQVSVIGGGVTTSTTGSDSITIFPAPVLSVTKSHTGTFTQGQTAVWNITVNNTAANSDTSGTTNLSDTLPTVYTVSSFTGTGWSCPGAVGSGSLSCTSSQVVAGGATFNTLQVTVNVPANSPTSVSNTALAWGGGDLTHASSATAATGTDSSVPVVQVPASIVVSTGSGQSATISSAFANPLVAKVTDAGGVAVAGASVTFAVPATGPSATITSTNPTGTNASGLASVNVSANATPGGPYSVTATVGSLTTSPGFSLTNNSSTVPSVVSYSVLWGSVPESYSVIGTTRNRLPWQITGIKVVFSEAIATGNASSLGGVAASSFSGLGTNTLTWTFSGLADGSYSTTLAGTGPNALKDSSGNALSGGAGFSQLVKILYGDFNDDGVVNAPDLSLVTAAEKTTYNVFADMNGDGVVNATDVLIVRAQEGHSLP
jgi:Big-like domain-containing protein/dockerin type I repeat protein